MTDLKTNYQQLYNILADTNEKIVYLFGAGISASLAGKNYSWEQWVRDGIALIDDEKRRKEYCIKLGDIISDDKQNVINSYPSSDTLISVLEELIQELKKTDNLYKEWMHNAFETLNVQNNDLANTLKKLLFFHDISVTTNYDNLLEQAMGTKAVSYLHPEIIYKMLDKCENNYTIHIHGRYSQRPEDKEDSIIATNTQYDKILNDMGAQFIQNVIGTRTVIFVGCGQTTSDKNISRFISFAKQYLNLDKTFYFLYREGDFPSGLPDNVIPVCYGSKYDDLSDFLESMVSVRIESFLQLNPIIDLFPAALTSKIKTAFPKYYFATEELAFRGRKQEIDLIESFMTDTEKCRWFAITGQSGCGKSRLALEICNRHSENWCAFFIKSTTDKAELLKFIPYRNTLIIIDDFKGMEANIAIITETLTELFSSSLYKLRIIFVERENSTISGTWSEELIKNMSKSFQHTFNSMQYGKEGTPFILLEDLNDNEIEEIIGEICKKYGLPTDKKRDSMLRMKYKSKLENLKYRPLFVQMYVEAWIDNACENPRFDNISGLLENILKREQERWLMELDYDYKLFNSWINLLLPGVVIGRLTRDILPDKYVSDFDKIVSFVKDHSFPGKQRKENFISLISDMCHNIEQKEVYIEPLYPDVIKEYCFLYYLDENRIVEVSNDLWSISPKDFMRYLIKLNNDFPRNERAYKAINDCEHFKYNYEALIVRIQLFSNHILQPSDKYEDLIKWVDREYDFWHKMAETYDKNDEKINILIFAGLETVAQQYGGLDSPGNSTIDKMLSVMDEALSLKGSEALEILKLAKAGEMATKLDIAGMSDKSKKLMEKFHSYADNNLNEQLTEHSNIERMNSDMMHHILNNDFSGACVILKKTWEHVKNILSVETVGYYLYMCRSLAECAFMSNSEKYIDRANYLAQNAIGLFEDDETIICRKHILRLINIQNESFNNGMKVPKNEISEILSYAFGIHSDSATECLSRAAILNLNYNQNESELLEIMAKLEHRLDNIENINNIENNGCMLAQTYLRYMQALNEINGKNLFTKDEISKAYAYMLRYPDSESVREVFFEMLENSVERYNKNNYLRREVLTAEISDTRYNPLYMPEYSGLDIPLWNDYNLYDDEPYVRMEKKIYPNDPCPCGSGKKYKKCCGKPGI